jgi:hypothetical protein
MRGKVGPYAARRGERAGEKREKRGGEENEVASGFSDLGLWLFGGLCLLLLLCPVLAVAVDALAAARVVWRVGWLPPGVFGRWRQTGRGTAGENKVGNTQRKPTGSALEQNVPGQKADKKGIP